jgi:hypothetical protein
MSWGDKGLHPRQSLGELVFNLLVLQQRSILLLPSPITNRPWEKTHSPEEQANNPGSAKIIIETTQQKCKKACFLTSSSQDEMTIP